MNWPNIFLESESKLRSLAVANGRISSAFYEFLRFALKQGWACLFGGTMLALLLATHFFYPPNMPVARYDLLTIAALAVQLVFIALKLMIDLGKDLSPIIGVKVA